MASNTDEDAEQKEAKQYWGYLFKQDKTGTDKLKKLLRGLHKIISTEFERSDSPDITPAQLAFFYRALNGNYDPLFLLTPPASIAFIYKNLGCLHSLQPPKTLSPEERFSEPNMPALKVEGWIMWQTIQLLLGPEEHAGFLMHAVKKWDVKDPDTGEVFPKVLPRSCFPAAPDSHMVAWYEGVSERLRREAEEEQRMKLTTLDHDSEGTGDSSGRHHRRHERDHTHMLTEGGQPDSRNSAIAYFRNPLYRTVDGRPSVVRRTSRRPQLSPRDTLMERGKYMATTVGHVVRNVGSPFLWDGGGNRDKDRDRRHKSGDRHRPADEDEDSDEAHWTSLHPRQGAGRRGSAGSSSTSDRHDRGSSDESPHRSASSHRHHHHGEHGDHVVRHRRSHEPAPSPREYFPPYDDPSRRRSSAYAVSPSSQESLGPGVGQPGFGPSVSPLFATQVGRGNAAASQRLLRSGGPQRRQEHGSPERSPSSGRQAGRVERSDSRRADDGARAPRPKVTRFETPVGGVGGRRYPNESAWR